MAFRTNLVPAIEERTVSGSSVSFNSAFALPLKACKVSFSATQSGSGTPSPQNVRPIVPVSSVDLLANSVSVIVPLGDSYGGGTLDLLSGLLTITHIKKTIDENSDITLAAVGEVFFLNDFFDIPKFNGSGSMCNLLQYILDVRINDTANAKQYLSNYQYCCNQGNTYEKRLFIKDSIHTSVADFKLWLTDNPIDVVMPLATPITIQLTPTQLSSIVGNNTFSTDTGTLEITFSDLQEKSASGSVATFNTALAMPLSSCNIDVNAWQEGSGEPSPSNVRPIHGFSEVNVTANEVLHTIQLGQEVYGAEVDVVNGVATLLFGKYIPTYEYFSVMGFYIKSDACDGFFTLPTGYPSYNTNKMPELVCCNRLKKENSLHSIWSEVGFPNTWQYNGRQIHLNIANDELGIVDYTQETTTTAKEKMLTWLANNPIELVVGIPPIDIQLTPTQIETIAGKTNTIFADTGDIDLTYKDLDIAKRGNFREVFKLLS